MYTVSAPAIDCDSQSGPCPDDATDKHKTKNSFENAAQFRPAPSPDAQRALEASEVAAKILQMHDLSRHKEKAVRRSPELVNAADDAEFSMPGVALHPRKEPEASRTIDDRRKPTTSPVPPAGRNGPGFLALALSTALFAIAGGLLLNFATFGSRSGEESANRLVRTEALTAKPVLAAPLSDTGFKQDALPEPKATRAQITLAKQRLRQAFAEGNTGAPTAISSRPEKQQAVQRSSTPGDLRLSPHPEGYPMFASAAQDLPLPGGFGQEGGSPGPGSQPIASTEPGRADARPPTSPDYPNTGKISASVNLRQSADKNAAVLTVIPEGTKVRFDTCDTWWCGVSFDGRKGFVGRNYLERSVQ